MLRILATRPWALAGGLGAIAAALVAAYAWGRLDGRALAEAAVFERIAEQNERAGNDAETCRDRYRLCVASGGVFDFAGCSCQR